MSFEDARNALVVAYADDSLDDEEFLILYDFYESVNPLYKYLNFDLFCFRFIRVSLRPAAEQGF